MKAEVTDIPGRRKQGQLSRWRVLLVPFSLTYWFFVSFRNLFYDVGIFKSAALPKPVVAVGNITTGGTGKTPLTLEIARHLQEKGCRPAILSRGYKSAAEKTGLVFRAAHGDQPSVNECGDEISMLARDLPGVWFGIGADRVASAKRVAAMAENSCFVLDDAFQHRKVRRDLNIAVIDARNPFGNNLLLPAGILREPLGGLERADVVVLSRCESVGDVELARIERRVKKSLGNSPIVQAMTRVTGIKSLRQQSGEAVPLSSGASVWALAAIANPEGFRRTLLENDFDVAGNSWFPDHHRYSAAEIAGVIQDASRHGAEAVVTTEKDAVKLAPSQFSNIPCYVVEIGFDFGAHTDIFWGIIDEVVQC